MKKLIMYSLLLCCIMFFVAGSAFAKKPTDDNGVYLGNGFPSGPHFNLNIHGKDPATFTCPDSFKMSDCPEGVTDCNRHVGEYGKYVNEGTPEEPSWVWKYSGSIFIPEYNCRFDSNGDLLPERIIVQSGKEGGRPKKGALILPTNQLIVTDACTECIPDDYDEAQFQLPPCDEGYRVYARVLGTPSNKKDTDRTIKLSSGDLLTAEDENGNNLLELGILTGNGYSRPDGSYSFTRNAKKSMGVAINNLFMFTGSICYLEEPVDFDSCNPDTDNVCQNSVENICATDFEDDGIYDVIVLEDEINGCPVWEKTLDENEGWICYLDENNYQVFDEGEEWIASDDEALCPEVDDIEAYCQYYNNVWIFGIADLVEYYFGVVNDGVKLIQLRFYPICDLAQQ